MSTTTILNFSHPITGQQLDDIRAAVSMDISEVKTIPVQFDTVLPFAEQVDAVIQKVGWDAGTWQTTPVLVNLPSLTNIAGVLLARLHGLMGHFPSIIVLRRTPDAQITTFELAEIVNLDSVRKRAASTNL